MEADRLEVVAARVGELPFVRCVRQITSSREASGADAILGVEVGDGSRSIAVIEKRGRIGRDVVSALSRRRDLEKFDAVMVVVPSLGSALKSELIAEGIGYTDDAGNLHLELDEGRLVAHIEGQRSETSSTAAGGAMRAAGYGVLFGFLAKPDLVAETIRGIAARTGASRFTVSSLLKRLADEGFLARSGRSGYVWMPGRRAELVERFTVGWRDVLASNLSLGTFRAAAGGESELEARFDEIGIDWGFGGTAAGMRLAPHYRSESTVMHVQGWKPRYVSDLRLAPDRDGPIQIYTTIGEFDLRSKVAKTAHPLLVFAELVRAKDPRSREAAEPIYEQYLKELVERDG